MSDLPEGWIESEFGEATQIVAGATPTSTNDLYFCSEGGIPWLTPADLSGYRATLVTRGKRNLTQNGYAACSAKLMPPGSVLFTSRAPIGYVAIAANEICTNQGFKSFVLPNGIESRFIYYYLRHLKPVAEMMATGTTFKELSGSAAARLPLRLAPFSEQKRIADKLDTLLARIDACRDRLDQVPKIIKQFRRSVLAAATSGKLTEDWRVATGADEWETVRLPDVANSRLGKMLDQAKNQGEEIPYLRNINVRWFGFDLSSIQVMRVTKKEVSDLFIKTGDVLVCEGGEPGRCALWKGEDDYYVFQKALHRIRVGERLTPEWLCYSLRDATDNGRLAKYFTGSTIKHLTGAALAKFEFLLPSIDEQQEIIRRVEHLFALADRLEARVKNARTKVGTLTPSTLAKAFRGELVPQDPNDEPASVLLERIRAEKVRSLRSESRE